MTRKIRYSDYGFIEENFQDYSITPFTCSFFHIYRNLRDMNVVRYKITPHVTSHRIMICQSISYIVESMDEYLTRHI